jgi:hypothetical protein
MGRGMKSGMRRQASFFTRKVAGWEWDDHLNGYLASKPNDFACKCGSKHAVPSYSICKCGKIWNSYVIGTGGDNHQASVEKFICREIPVRDNVIVANRKTAMPRPKNSEYHNAYNAGWNASNRTTTYDMGGALERYKGPHIDHFDMGWTDNASDYVHRFRQPEQYLADYKAMYAPHYDDFELHPETRELVRRKQASRRTSRDDDPIIKYTEDDHQFVPGEDESGGQDWELKDEDGYYGDFQPSDFCGVCNKREDEHGQHKQGSRRTAKEGGCTCWEGYERVPGTKPCASGSCRKKSNRERNRSRDAGKVKRHNVSEEGPLGEGKDDKMPDISNELGSDWYRRGPGGKYARNRRGR